jgi:hypothetical protein
VTPLFRGCHIFWYNTPKGVKCTKRSQSTYIKWPWNIPNGNKIYQMAIKYIYQMAIKYIKCPLSVRNGHIIYQHLPF